MLDRIVRLSPIGAALLLAWTLPAVALDIGSSCTNDEARGCEIGVLPPSMDLQRNDGTDRVTFENGRDSRPDESMISSDAPGEMIIETPSEPSRGDGEGVGNGDMTGGGDMIGEGDHPIMGEPGDHLPAEGGSDAIRDSLGDPPVGDFVTAVPEPAGLLMLAIAAGGLLLAGRRA